MPLDWREEERAMKRIIGVTAAVVLVAGMATAAMAQPGWGQGRGPGRMAMMQGGGPGWMGPGAGGPGFGRCGGGGWGAGQQSTEAITEEKATALANEYVAKYFKGYTVERVLPFQGRVHTMYQVELKGPAGEKRTLHVNPWGAVRPFGPPLAAAQ
jgi:hypothetical protein